MEESRVFRLSGIRRREYDAIIELEDSEESGTFKLPISMGSAEKLMLNQSVVVVIKTNGS